MTSLIQTIGPMDSAWSDFVASCPNSTAFHHPAWLQLLADCYGYGRHVLVLVDAHGKIEAGLPFALISSWPNSRRLVSLPFTDICSPLSVHTTAQNELLNSLPVWAKQMKSSLVEVRWSAEQAQAAVQPDAFYRHVTRLAVDPSQIWRRLRGSIRRMVSQAKKSGVVVRRGNGWESVRAFYNLHLHSRRRMGLPVQPLRFFRLLWERLIANDMGYVLLACKDARPVAGAVFLAWNGTIIYKYGASDPQFWSLRPNNLLFWHAIQHGCEAGYQSFDWGRTGVDNVGLRQFKRGWASEETVLRYSLFGDAPRKPHISTAGRNLLASMIRISPAWVCRAIGEVTYGRMG